MSWIKRPEIPVLIAGIVGFLILFEYHFRIPAVSTVTGYLANWVTVIAGFALGTGLLSLMLLHGRHVARRTPGEWYFSVWWFAMFTSMSAVGLALGMSSTAYSWMFSNILTPLYMTVASTTAFFIVTAAYRAFRARTLDATVLLLTAGFVMLQNAPVGGAISPILPQIGEWISMIPNVGARRALILGTGIAGISLALRTFLGMERSYMGEGG